MKKSTRENSSLLFVLFTLLTSITFSACGNLESIDKNTDRMASNMDRLQKDMESLKKDYVSEITIALSLMANSIKEWSRLFNELALVEDLPPGDSPNFDDLLPPLSEDLPPEEDKQPVEIGPEDANP